MASRTLRKILIGFIILNIIGMILYNRLVLIKDPTRDKIFGFPKYTTQCERGCYMLHECGDECQEYLDCVKDCRIRLLLKLDKVPE